MSCDPRPAAVVIEDDPHIRQLVCAILQKLGLRVVAAADGATGVEAVREHDPAVVTVDIRMPGMDGFESVRRIRDFSDAYVLVITARDDDGDAWRARQAGADVLMRKPFRPRELRAKVEPALARTRRAAQ
jgi:DNA-binding response OmpR family regulator